METRPETMHPVLDEIERMRMHLDAIMDRLEADRERIEIESYEKRQAND